MLTTVKWCHINYVGVLVMFQSHFAEMYIIHIYYISKSSSPSITRCIHVVQTFVTVMVKEDKDVGDVSNPHLITISEKESQSRSS